MAQYVVLVRVNIQHDFFSDGICRNLAFQATAATKKMLDSYRLLLKPTRSGFDILADADWGFEPDETLRLHIEAYAGDSYFALYTEEIQTLDGMRCYRIENITGDNSGLALQEITAQEYRSGNEGPTPAGPGVLKKPVIGFEVAIEHQALGIFDVQQRESLLAAPAVQLQLHARAFHWKYYFFGELANLDTEIHDLYSPSPVVFDLCDEAVPDSGKAFLSQQSIVMSDVPKQRFQLKEKTSPGRVLIKRLPNAGLGWIAKSRNLAGQQILVAEIYVNQ